MKQSPRFSDALAGLSALKALLDDGDLAGARGLVAELFQRLTALRNENDLLKANSVRLSVKAKELKARVLAMREDYEQGQATFERFRRVIALVQRMRSFRELPTVLENIRQTLGLSCIRLVLDKGEFEGHVPDSVPLSEDGDLIRLLDVLPCEPKGFPSYLGPVKDLASAGAYLSEGVCGPDFPQGSCYVRALSDRFHPERPMGFFAFCDPGPERYSPDKATDYLDHFCEVFAAVLADVMTHRRAQALREDVERITRHDLKTPLNAILSLPFLMREGGPLNERQERYLDMLQDTGYRMLRMINLSMDLHKMEKGSYVLCPAPVDLPPLLRRIGQELGSLAEAGDQGLDLFLDGAAVEEGTVFTVFGEELLCYSALANLVKNALEASPEGARVRIDLISGHPAEVRIHNLGAVPEEVRGRFFEKYASTKAEGTGLGAYSARLMVRTMGGDIAMRSAGDETTITAFLPTEAVETA